MLLELFTSEGIGTMVVPDHEHAAPQAYGHDVPAVDHAQTHSTPSGEDK